jgi:plastocyanin
MSMVFSSSAHLASSRWARSSCHALFSTGRTRCPTERAVSTSRSAPIVRLVGLAALLTVGSPLAVRAQQATPTISTEGITLAASGLANPRGFAWGADGSFYVTEAGAGGLPPVGATPVASGMESAGGGLTGTVAYVDNGCPVAFEGDLPSTRGTTGSVRGPAAVALLDNRVYVAIAGGGASNDNPTTPNGIYGLDGDGSAELVADLGSWMAANPVAVVPGDYGPDGDPFSMVAGDDELWVVEANSGQLLRITTDGAITRLVDFSTGTHRVPTGLALAPDGSLYVGFLTSAPYTDGASKVVRITADGAVSDVWTGLTAVTGVAFGADGSLYALEMGTGNTDTPPFAAPGTGKVVRQAGRAESVDIATGLDRPVAMAFGPDGGLYVATPAFGPTSSNGAVVRLDLSQGQTLTMDDALLATSTCPGAVATPTPALAATPVTPNITGASTPAAAPTGSAAPASGGGSAVTLVNYSFSPTSLQVALGTTVTWTNNDTAAHTVTADDGSFDSGNLAPGQSFTHTFTTSGTVAYHCNYHPNMVASVVVQ